MPKADRNSIEGIQFVHCAIPNLALNDVDTSYKLKEGFVLPYPIAVMCESEEEAKEISQRSKDTPFNFKGLVFINGKQVGQLKSTYLVEVRDGIEAAKAVRLDKSALPCIGKADLKELEIYIKQLRVAMFLTNSKSIQKLEAAPIYNMR